jgi:hypothetical protein
MPAIQLPNSWKPRSYQLPLWSYLENGGKRASVIWHRRAGKDDVCLSWQSVAMMQRPGVYWHMLPMASQARKAIWTAVDPHTGLRRIDRAFPKALRSNTRENEMSITLKNNSLWQVVGSDNFNALVGSPPVGVVFSEWALANPAAWAYLRPILAENGGWALFITTPRGRNHAFKMHKSAEENRDWFAERLTVADTGVFTHETLDEERRENIDLYGPDDGENLFQQEYYCSFEAAIVGAYYGKAIADVESAGRVVRSLYDSALPVYTAWDLGVGDSTVIWFAQLSGREIRIVDHYASAGVGLDHYVKVLKAKPYAYELHILPHDAKQRQQGIPGARTREDQLREFEIGRLKVLDSLSIEDGINAVRRILPRCWFDKDKTEPGVEALRNYRKEWDEDQKVFHNRPLHDWASDHADAFRYLALGIPDSQPSKAPVNLVPEFGTIA